MSSLSLQLCFWDGLALLLFLFVPLVPLTACLMPARSTFMVAVAIFFCQLPNILCIFDKLPVEN